MTKAQLDASTYRPDGKPIGAAEEMLKSADPDSHTARSAAASASNRRAFGHDRMRRFLQKNPTAQFDDFVKAMAEGKA
jgi:hypothetical protein